MAKGGGGKGGPTLYYEIADFKQGMDLRKSALTAPAGTMRLLQNAHITPGGEIEKRSVFQYWCDAPAGSIGLSAANGQPYTHLPGGSNVAPSDSNIGVVGIAPPSGITLYSQGTFDVYNGMIYAIFWGYDASSNWGIYHYYNGAFITGPSSSPGSGARGVYIRTYKEKMYGLIGRTLYFSAVGDPTTWVDPPPDASGNVAHNGSGFRNLGANDADSDNLVSMEVYYDKMAIFSELSCQLWFLDPDPSLNQYYQTLRDAGTVAARSVKQYVANDVYFLGTHGIRSLRARDLSLTAAVADVGSPLDPLIQQLLGNPGQGWMSTCIAVLSPRSGRIWMVFPDRIYILSNFASPNISAWSVYLTTDQNGTAFQVADAVFADPYIILRDANNHLYRFGNTGPLQYDASPVTVLLPWLSFDKPTTFKWYEGFDAICTNTWNVQASLDPALDGQAGQPWDQWCQLTGPTMLLGRIPVQSRSTHVQLQLTCNTSGPATFSKLFVHYSPSDTD